MSPRVLLPVGGLLALACAGPRPGWYDDPMATEGKPYADCEGSRATDGELAEGLSFNRKGNPTQRVVYDAGEVEAVYTYVYDKDDKTLVELRSGPSESNVTHTEAYEYEKGNLVHVDLVDDEETGGLDITYGDHDQRASEDYTFDGDPDADFSVTWTWTDGDDGGTVADLVRDDEEGRITHQWDADRFLVRETLDFGDAVFHASYEYDEDARLVTIRADGGGATQKVDYGYSDDGRVSRVETRFEFQGDATQLLDTWTWSCD